MKQKATIIGYITYIGFYWWLGYPSLPEKTIAGFWQGLMHGFFFLPRWIYEIWMDFTAFATLHEGGYVFAFIIGIPLAGVSVRLYMKVFLIVFQIVTRIRLK